MNEPVEIKSLKEALAHSPDNLPLHLLLAQSLVKHQLFEQAETALLEYLKKDPTHAEAKQTLCECYHKQGKFKVAQVLIDSLLEAKAPSASIHILAMQQELGSGNIRLAVDHYKQAVSMDPSLEDKALNERFGVQFDEEAPNADVVDGRIREKVDADDDLAIDKEMERPSINFEQVGGMDSVKEEIQLKIIHPLNNKDIYKAYGKKIGGGVLMFGPPGCGKTYLARATAGEIQGNFLSIGLHDVLDMWIGQSEQQLHAIFEQARTHRPTVLFFDEVDALAANRSDLKKSAGRQVINQFLSEMDGAEQDNEGVLILAATNAPWHMDPAFRRPGRFDRIIFVPPPDEKARETIFGIMLKDKPTRDIDIKKIAGKTARYSGADIKNVIDLAIEEKLKMALKTGIPEPLETKDLLKAIKKHRPSTQEWFASAKNYALYSNQGGMYDEILEYLK